MKKFGSTGIKVLKIIHLVFAGLWLSGAITLVLMFFALGPGKSNGEILGYVLSMKFVDDAIVIPGALGSLLSGILISVFTNWGFFKHRWVTIKYVLTVAGILVGTFVLGPRVNAQPGLAETLGMAAPGDPGYASNLGLCRFIGPIMVTNMLFMVAISVLKPWKKKKKAEAA
ncbi:MAG: DUF2269 family protein [Deltaproteobacteria bacterium]|jgi:uncharacterized membrane protein SirB2|nr:DUF2269 family protein [Deltaproteobacteria bacterium]